MSAQGGLRVCISSSSQVMLIWPTIEPYIKEQRSIPRLPMQFNFRVTTKITMNQNLYLDQYQKSHTHTREKNSSFPYLTSLSRSNMVLYQEWLHHTKI